MTQRVRSRIGSVFVGREGLRAGWRFLLFAFGIFLGVRFVEDPLSQFLAQRLAINLNELSRNGEQMPVDHLFEVTFPGPAWLNGGDLGTEASIFMVPAAIATFIYVVRFLRQERGVGSKTETLRTKS